MMKLKICGMKNRTNIEEVAALQPDYLGFIFYDNSPRNAGEAVIPEIDASIKKTGVFVNAPLDFIQNKIIQHGLMAVQLHGEESPELCKALKKQVEVIKVFSVGETFDFSNLAPFEDKVNYFLFDTLGKAKGGNGKTFNWEVLKTYPSKIPFFLSGGIGLSEIQDLKKLALYFRNLGKEDLFYAVDVNSRFEIQPGLKNVKDLERFKKQIDFGLL